MELLGLLWNEVIIRPMINSLVLLYVLLFHNFGLTIIVFTIIINGLTFPLTLKSIRQTQGMSAIQPRLQELRKRYGDDRQRISQETMRLYREYGVNPLGCLGPFAVQMPVLLGLYWSIIKTLPAAPERLADLSSLLYSRLSVLGTVLPLHSGFLGFDLALVGGAHGLGGYLLMVLVGASMWVSMKMTTPQMSGGGGTQQQTQQMMQWMFPVMIGFISLSLPTGLSLYWISSSLIRVLIQYGMIGRKSLTPLRAPAVERDTAPLPVKEIVDHGSDGPGPGGSDSKDRRRGDRTRPQAARRRARRSRNRGR